MTGCAISRLVFTIAVEVFIRASKLVMVVKGCRMAPGYFPSKHKDDMTALTTTAPCSCWLLAKLNDSLNESET